MLDPVAITGLLVAAIRAEESQRNDRLFSDPFAAALAGDDGRAALGRYRAAVGPSIPIIEVRTRHYDAALAAVAAAGVRQFVILAAGMDARAYRLPWPADARILEIDQPAVLARKAHVLSGALPRCARVAVAADLADSWAAPLRAHDFDAGAPTAWLIEGLLQYLDAATVAALFARIDALSAPGSRLLYDVVGRSLLEAPPLAPTLRMMQELGAPWVFASDEPAALPGPGWDAVLTDPAAIGNAWGRWPTPVLPPGAPRGYLVDATRH